jgi:hypothetical protein
VSAHTVRGAGLAALLLPLVLLTVPSPARAQAASPQWSTYVGGSGVEVFYSIAQHPLTQDIVVGGVTDSAGLTPVTRAPTGVDALVSIFTKAGALRPNADAKHVVFGGTDFDQVTAVAIGSEGQIYAVGRTRSPSMPDFPKVHRSHGGDFDAFVAELGPDGERRWFMYLGSTGDEVALGVASAGKSVYITGYTSSNATVTSQAFPYATPEAFVARLDTSTATPTFLWHHVLTGNVIDELSGIKLDPEGNLFVVGTLTPGMRPDLPNTNSYLGGDSDAVALKVNSVGALVWMTYVGGPGKDTGHGIAVTPGGEVVVAGALESPGNGRNAMVVRLNRDGVEQGRRVLGGARDDVARSVAVDSAGNLYVGGETGSASMSARGAFDPKFEGLSEGFVAMIPAQGGPGWTSYVGGEVEDYVTALSISTENRLVMTGRTKSSSGLPGPGGLDSTQGGDNDGFIVAVDPDTTPPAAGRVYDRPGNDQVHEDVSQHASLTSISASWDGFSDKESGVVEYEWAIGTEASPESMKAFAPVGTATSATAAELTLVEGTAYVVTVRAINGAGLVTTVRSDGVTVTVPREQEGGGDQIPVGWSCAATVDASLPMLLGLMALAMRRRRSGAPARRV